MGKVNGEFTWDIYIQKMGTALWVIHVHWSLFWHSQTGNVAASSSELTVQTSIKVPPAESLVFVSSTVVKDVQNILARRLNATH